MENFKAKISQDCQKKKYAGCLAVPRKKKKRRRRKNKTTPVSGKHKKN